MCRAFMATAKPRLPPVASLSVVIRKAVCMRIVACVDRQMTGVAAERWISAHFHTVLLVA